MSFDSIKADPDKWILLAEYGNGFRYYDMLFIYVKNICLVSQISSEVIIYITSYYNTKGGSVKSPEIYLGVI